MARGRWSTRNRRSLPYWKRATLSSTAAALLHRRHSEAKLLASKINYIDVGSSGGVWEPERGYCMMIGSETEIVRPVNLRHFGAQCWQYPRTSGCESSVHSRTRLPPLRAQRRRSLKMVHNGIDAASRRTPKVKATRCEHRQARAVDAETTPLHVRTIIRFKLRDIAENGARSVILRGCSI